MYVKGDRRYVKGDRSSLCGLIDSVRFSSLLDQMTVVVGKKVNLIVLKGYVLKEWLRMSLNTSAYS